MDRTRHHSKSGVSLTAETPSHAPARRRLWVLIPLVAFLAARLVAVKADAASDTFPLSVGQSTLEVTIDGRPKAATTAELRTWIEKSARGVAAYFGRFPVPRARLLVRVGDGRRVKQGKATPGNPPTVRLTVGADATARDLDADWMLVHELVHLGFPDVEGPHEWMSEGFSTYIEPVVRIKNGTLSPEKFWSDFRRDMPQGLPGTDERGLNSTQSWASTYWGGALFWFLTDVQIRQATGGKRGLEDAFRALNRQDGNFNASWSVSTFIQTLDDEVGSPVVRQMYDTWALQRGSVDLNSLWARLGVGTRLDDAAPMADIRKSITRKTP